jgi:hypothetical protein
MTGLPRNAGLSRCSTEAKNASVSRWAITRCIVKSACHLRHHSPRHGLSHRLALDGKRPGRGSSAGRASPSPAGTNRWGWPLPCHWTHEAARPLIRRGPQPPAVVSRVQWAAAPPARADFDRHLLGRLGSRFFSGFPRFGPERRSSEVVPEEDRTGERPLYGGTQRHSGVRPFGLETEFEFPRGACASGRLPVGSESKWVVLPQPCARAVD